MIKAVAFDYDHTLYDRDLTNDNLTADYCRFFKDYLRPDVTREEVCRAIKQADGGSFKRKRSHNEDISTKQAGKHWLGIYNATLATGIFAKEPGYDFYYYEFIEKYFTKAMAPYPDTLPTLQWLRDNGYKTGILTNGPSDFQQAKLDALDMYDKVDAVVLCGDLPQQKPHPITFQTVCEKMGCRTEEAIYVGDNPFNDIDGARRAGMIPVWIRSVGVWLDNVEPAPYAIDAIGELPALLEKIQQDLGG